MNPEKQSQSMVRIDDDVYTWLFNHRTLEEKSISSVIRGLIKNKEETK